jgi:hypothetical protein
MTEMLLEYGVVIDTVTGEVCSKIEGSSGVLGATSRSLPPGRMVVPTPSEAIRPAGLEVDLDLLKQRASANVGATAELARHRFVTPGEAKSMSYMQKANEARAWSVNSSAVTPILAAEAAVRGMSMTELATEILEMEAAWIAAEAQINAAEMGAKQAIQSATNIAQIVAAGSIDWDTVTSPQP